MATKTLTGYIAGATGANWLVSTVCKAQFDLMAAAAIKPATEGGCGATLTLVDGYVSRYEAIRQLVAVKNYTADPTLEGNVKDLTKNLAIADDQWIQLENNFNQSISGLNYANIFKTNHHAYLGDGLLLAVGGADNAGGVYGCQPKEDLRRTGDVVKIAANGKGAMNADNEADWMLVSGSQFGFYFLGPDVQTFAFNPTFKFGPNTLGNIKRLGSRVYFLVRAADEGQIPTQFNAAGTVLTTGWDNEEFKRLAYNVSPKDGLAYYANWVAQLKKKGNFQVVRDFQFLSGDAKAKAQICAFEWNQPWLFGMEKII